LELLHRERGLEATESEAAGLEAIFYLNSQAGKGFGAGAKDGASLKVILQNQGNEVTNM
jgi:hypothetical protein